MKLLEKIDILIICIILTLFFCTVFGYIKEEILIKKDIRNTKEKILLNHGFMKEEIKLLLDY